MLVRISKIGLLSLMAGLLVACGGGGGGGGGGAGSNAKSGVRLIHASLDVSPVTLKSAADTEFDSGTSRFAQPAYYRKLAEGADVLSVVRAYAPTLDALGSVTLTGDGQKKETVLFYGDLVALGLRTAVIEDQIPDFSKERAVIRVLHALGGALSIKAEIQGAGSLTASYGDGSEYIEASAGPIGISVSRVADSRIIFSGSRMLEAGKAHTLLLAGEVDYLVVAPIYIDN